MAAAILAALTMANVQGAASVIMNQGGGDMETKGRGGWQLLLSEVNVTRGKEGPGQRRGQGRAGAGGEGREGGRGGARGGEGTGSCMGSNVVHMS